MSTGNSARNHRNACLVNSISTIFSTAFLYSLEKPDYGLREIVFGAQLEVPHSAFHERLLYFVQFFFGLTLVPLADFVRVYHHCFPGERVLDRNLPYARGNLVVERVADYEREKLVFFRGDAHCMPPFPVVRDEVGDENQNPVARKRVRGSSQDFAESGIAAVVFLVDKRVQQKFQLLQTQHGPDELLDFVRSKA